MLNKKKIKNRNNSLLMLNKNPRNFEIFTYNHQEQELTPLTSTVQIHL